MAEGLELGLDLTPEGARGRLGDIQDVQDIAAQRKAQSGGFTPQEMEMMRSDIGKTIGRGMQDSVRAQKSAQGQTGVVGSLAGAQQEGIRREGQEQMADQERGLQIQNIAEKRRSLDSYQDFIMDQSKFDIGQHEKERGDILGTGLTQQIMGLAERQGMRSTDVAREAARLQSGGGKK